MNDSAMSFHLDRLSNHQGAVYEITFAAERTSPRRSCG
jgi:hypothetical protein